MNINFSAFPTTIDMLHLGLGLSALLFLVLFLTKNKSSTNETVDAVLELPVQQPVEEAPKAAQLKEAAPDAALLATPCFVARDRRSGRDSAGRFG